MRTPVFESAFAVAVDQERDAMNVARKISHDIAIFSTGRARRSGVQWSYWPTVDPQEALRADGTDIVLPAEVLAACAEVAPDGVLVIATVMVDPDVEP